MKKKLVSVILPVYNGEKYLEQSIRSILDQTYKDIELIIVNDCSTDSSLSIAQKLAKVDNRIKIVINSTNLKLPKSLNVGFLHANGEYYTWTSDDNFYDITAIEKMVDYLEKNQDISLVCCNFLIVNEITNNEKVCKLDVSPIEMIKGNCIGACFLYKKEVADKVGEYNPNEFLVEDYDYWLRFMLIGNVAHIPEILYTYRVHQASLTEARMPEILDKTFKLQKKYLPLYKKKWKNLKFEKAINKNKRKLTMLQRIFSIKNENDRKVIRLFGINIKLKRNKK